MNTKLLSRSFFPFTFFDEDEELFPTNRSASEHLSIYEDDQHVVIEAFLPGLETKDIDITYDKGILWIKGQKKEAEEDKKRKYYRRATTSFSYRVAVPGLLDENIEPEAQFTNGQMTVKFAKQKRTEPKKISVK